MSRGYRSRAYTQTKEGLLAAIFYQDGHTERFRKKFSGKGEALDNLVSFILGLPVEISFGQARYLAAVHMFFVDGLSLDAIAKSLDIESQTVVMRRSRGLTLLRSCLIKDRSYDPDRELERLLKRIPREVPIF